MYTKDKITLLTLQHYKIRHIFMYFIVFYLNNMPLSLSLEYMYRMLTFSMWIPSINKKEKCERRSTGERKVESLAKRLDHHHTSTLYPSSSSSSSSTTRTSSSCALRQKQSSACYHTGYTILLLYKDHMEFSSVFLSRTSAVVAFTLAELSFVNKTYHVKYA